MSQKSIEVIVHIDEALSKPNIIELEELLSKDHGIEKVHINPTRQHLMLVDYSPESVNMTQVLEYVKNKGVHAQLVGGI
ncbi:MAG: heavy-metal-associated domain-containing protein [gamma proteobacterium symbiont of Bathyaustriella thionipta]|nr:heavy-metal-associated domain-containing protein [gamma proteobacterium symbiont of Bathyaustriella thionipta]MCU7950829.1 heavy-metal-associated domain-containing protein [gamma proteobacterium symbiont of Bathyaustriella thionipta]MCU7951905.1 heavy-metal-associated domain-containing protein [gamma proteobacterium symbiont of Bathyaustriella thionipta]MCU7957351.1 heavy-metal-associated domain-containing protein [gamma proteobacterium symbiont of Bathyaustriella thionipta]MCU7966660.1 heav